MPPSTEGIIGEHSRWGHVVGMHLQNLEGCRGQVGSGDANRRQPDPQTTYGLPQRPLWGVTSYEFEHLSWILKKPLDVDGGKIDNELEFRAHPTFLLNTCQVPAARLRTMRVLIKAMVAPSNGRVFLGTG